LHGAVAPQDAGLLRPREIAKVPRKNRATGSDCRYPLCAGRGPTFPPGFGSQGGGGHGGGKKGQESSGGGKQKTGAFLFCNFVPNWARSGEA